MIKRLLSFILVLAIFAFSGICGISATDSTNTSKQIIYFEVPETWEGYSKVYCHVWDNQGSLASWGSKKSLCTKTDTERIYAFNLSKLGGISEDKPYFLVFHTDAARQRHREVVFSTDCLGDTLYCTDKIIYTPEGENFVMAHWKNQDPSVYGSYLPRNWGDVDYSGEVNIKDATTVQKFVAGILDEGTPLMQDADFNRDTEINIKDVTDIQKYLAGILKLLQI